MQENKNFEVVVTGIGIVSALGLGREQTWKMLIDGKSEIKQDHIYKNILSARVSSLPVPEAVKPVAFAFLAANEALFDAHFENFITSRFGCTVSASKQHLLINRSNKVSMPDFFSQTTIGNQIHKIFRLEGPLQNTVAACATGIHSVATAMHMIKHGYCDAAFCGAVESSFNPLYVAGFDQLGVLSKTKVSPFGRQRDGFAMAEGAVVFVLERKDKAVMRSAKIYGEITGWDLSTDASSIMNFDPKGKNIAASICRALKHSGNKTIDYIHAHGTATKLNDVSETNAIKSAFGGNAAGISISSTKAATGHMLGASGAAGLAFSLLAMRDSMVPPTLNLNDPDPELNLDYTPNKAKHRLINSTLTLAFGFGGQIGTMVCSKNN